MRNFILATLVLISPLISYAADYKAGVDYYILDEAIAEESKTLIEFYNFACVYCFRAEGGVKQVLQNLPENISFKRIPVILGRGERYKIAAQVSYIAAQAGLLDKYHSYIFQLSRAPVRWELQRYNRLSSIDDAKKFFSDVGISNTDFDKFLIASQPNIIGDEAFAKKLGVPGTPSFLIKGQYLVSGMKNVPFSEYHLANLIVHLLNIEEK